MQVPVIDTDLICDVVDHTDIDGLGADRSCGLVRSLGDFLGGLDDLLCLDEQNLLVPVIITVIVRTEVDVILAVSGDGVVVIHAIGEPSGGLAVGVDNLELIFVRELQSNGVFLCIRAVYRGQLIRVVSRPVIERTDCIISALCGSGGGLYDLGDFLGGSDNLGGLFAYEFHIVVTLIVGLLKRVPPSAVCDTVFDIYSLSAVAVEDDALNICGDLRGVDLLAKVIGLYLGHRLAGPIAAVRPVINIRVAIVLSVGEFYGDGLCRSGGGISGSICLHRCVGGLDRSGGLFGFPCALVFSVFFFR